MKTKQGFSPTEIILQLLLSRDEGPTLEFKREWYKLSGEGESKARQRDELIKDILSLANGNAYSAGETAYLIVGAENQRNEDGSRTLYDVGDVVPTAASILDFVRAASNPPLENLEVMLFQVENKHLFAIIVLPSPHLYETTRRLDTPSQSYSKYVVFIRRNDSVDIASARERETIKKLKEIRFAETRNVPPVLFGTAIGAAIGGTFLARVGEKITGRKEGFVAGLVVGPIMGGLFGGMMGSSYKTIMEIRSDWSRIPVWGRAVALLAGGLSAMAVWIAAAKIGDRLSVKNDKKVESGQTGG